MVRPHNLVVLFTTSIIFALLFSTVFIMGYKQIKSMGKEVYADNIMSVSEISYQEERTIPIFKEVEVEKVINPVSMRKIGEFRLTAYCPCNICCEKWGGSPTGKTTAIGVGAYQGITFAVDPNVIPYGSKIYIEGVGVGIATDCGGAIKGNRIDVYFSNHNDALVFGRAGGVPHSVYIIE